VSDLDGRVIAVAGAAGGLGPSVATHLADAGATLALTDVARERLDELAKALDLPEDRIDARAVDLLEEEGPREWRDQLIDRFGRVDGLMHLVGGWRGGDPLDQADLDDYVWLHDLLVRTVQHTTRAFLHTLMESGRGRFVLVSSSAARRPESTNAAYAAAKAAAEAWTLAMADALAGTGGTANIVVVNAILTPSMREENPDKEYRTFTPAEHIAEAIAFLCSDAAQRMNGQRLSLHP
jgi:NAD(P)-dependent dehydrogenase (short-subunit alcohol dehydrogenase family)